MSKLSKFFFRFLLIAATFLTVLVVTPDFSAVSAKTKETTKASDKMITFNNKKIEDIIRNKLGKKKGSITTNDVTQIQYLYINNSDVSDISDLKWLTSLKGLVLSNNSIKNIEVLSNLKNLEELSLYHNNITDISPIKGCTKLKDLDFSYNKVKEISVLKNLVKLERLSFNNNYVKSIGVVKNFTKLEYLQMQDNMFTDISAVLDLRSLKSLSLYNSYIKSYKALDQLSRQLEYKDFNLEKDTMIADKVAEIIEQIIKPGMTDYEKELAIHDYIINQTVYDYENYINDAIPDESYTPYGVLMKGVGVCGGYARTFKLFMDCLGIECYYVIGEAYGLNGWEAHAWNIVKIDGDYYQIDITWDDPDFASSNKVQYFFMNIQDSEMMLSHRWAEKEYPKCSSVYYNYNYYNRCMEDKVSIKAPSFITGQITLPQNELAPKGGLELTMSLTIMNYRKEQKTSYNPNFRLIIPAGKNSIDYKVAVPKSDYEYKLNVNVFNSNQYLGGNYTTQGLAEDFNEYTPITPDSSTDIDINLTRNSTMPNQMPISVSLPKGRVAPAKGLPVKIVIQNEGHTGITDILIPEGKNTVQGVITTQQSDTNQYYLYYLLESQDSSYINRGYYSSKGMTADTKNADLITFTNSAEYKLDIMKGNSQTQIKGKISLPSGAAAPKGGLHVKVIAHSDNASSKNIDDITYTGNYTIPEGKNSLAYQLPVTYAPFGYAVSYMLTDKVQDYVSFGYYSDKGTQTNKEMMSKVFADTYNLVNFTIGKGCVIEGSLSLPSGDVAPVGGITAEIIAMSFNDTYGDAGDDFKDSIRVTIPEGKSAVGYSIAIDGAKQGYSIYYQLVTASQSRDKEKYVLSGLGMKDGFAYKLIKSNVTIVDFTLTHARVVKGTISLPNGETVQRFGMDFMIQAVIAEGSSDALFNGSTFSANVTIPEGKNSAEYTLLIPDVQAQYYIKYLIMSDNYGYHTEGMVGDNGTVNQATQAHRYKNGSDGEINIVIIRSK